MSRAERAPAAATAARRGTGDGSARAARIVVVGAVNVDFVVAARTLPGPGETVVGEGCERHGGGKGANAAVAAARLGADVRLIGAIGDDETGRAALAELAAAGVDVEGVAMLEGTPTGVALIVVDANGENQIAVGAGANAKLDADWVTARLDEQVADAGCVLVSTEIPDAAVLAAVRATRDAGVRCVLNPAPPTDAVIDALADRLLLTPNATELAILAARLELDATIESAANTSERERERAAARAGELARRTDAAVVVTLGGDGALVVAPGEQPRHVAARAARVVDTTGAGDTFNGALAMRLASGEDLEQAASCATLAAGLSVGGHGARGGMPDAKRLDAALAEAT